MGVVVKGNVYVNGNYVGNESECSHPIKDGVFNADYEQPNKYEIKQGRCV